MLYIKIYRTIRMIKLAHKWNNIVKRRNSRVRLTNDLQPGEFGHNSLLTDAGKKYLEDIIEYLYRWVQDQDKK